MDAYTMCIPYLFGMTHVSKVGSVFTTLAVRYARYEKLELINILQSIKAFRLIGMGKHNI